MTSAQRILAALEREAKGFGAPRQFTVDVHMSSGKVFEGLSYAGSSEAAFGIFNSGETRHYLVLSEIAGFTVFWQS